MKTGCFIVIDGGEGAGKSTVISRLKEVLSPNEVIFTREPGGSVFAEEIRALVLSPRGGEADAVALFFLFCAARAEHGTKKILPAIENGLHVISDRYDSSTWAYQICAGGNDSLRNIFWQMRGLCSPVIPNLYVYLDIDPEDGLRRTQIRGETNHFEAKDINFHSRVREGFFEFIDVVRTKGSHVEIVDANQSVERVCSQVLASVCKVMV